jgi:hypothetical protein
MARFHEPTAGEVKSWRRWVKGRPPKVRAMAERFEPWSLYQLKTTNHRVTVASFSEDGTMTVDITAEFNLLDFERQVFGIKPEDLEPCDLPAPDEALGALFSNENIDDHIDELRVRIRPDLWAMGEDGVAVRKS